MDDAVFLFWVCFWIILIGALVSGGGLVYWAATGTNPFSDNVEVKSQQTELDRAEFKRMVRDRKARK